MLTDKAKYLQMIVDGGNDISDGQRKIFHGISGYLDIVPECPKAGRTWFRILADSAQGLDVFRFDPKTVEAFDAVAKALRDELEIWGSGEEVGDEG